MQEIRPHIRREPPPADALVVLRGGSESVEKLARHAERTRRAHLLDGQPIYGLSAYCVPHELLNEVLERRLSTYPRVRLSTVGRLRAGGFPLLPTFATPHYTILLAMVDTAELERLLACFEPPSDNPRCGTRWQS